MRVARVLVPLAVAGMVLAGCGDRTAGGATWSAPSAPAGNGVADLTADEILAKATAALDKAGSFQIKGQAREDGTTMSVDLKVQGKDLVGTIDMGSSTIQTLLVGGQPYFKADEAFWKENGGPQGAGLAQLVGDRWVKVSPKDEDFANVFKLGDPDEILKPDGKVSKGASTSIDAGPVITLIDKSDQSKLYVATTGEPYPLLTEDPDKQGKLVFSGFGDSFPEIKKPDAQDVIDFSKL
ncbi:hypothetical protein [Micromonospora thermarum]|uniref:Lipoprotein n=1 Tax=Micromonospora thermarum TaxID=2720024 RepID=A0ABX0ZD48_9ACTN|nr:hypothetical protein [Micromonospora thermarum]NJP34414.1 hypothetical protein [Micromonospora thermarum]